MWAEIHPEGVQVNKYVETTSMTWLKLVIFWLTVYYTTTLTRSAWITRYHRIAFISRSTAFTFPANISWWTTITSYLPINLQITSWWEAIPKSEIKTGESNFIQFYNLSKLYHNSKIYTMGNIQLEYRLKSPVFWHRERTSTGKTITWCTTCSISIETSHTTITRSSFCIV